MSTQTNHAHRILIAFAMLPLLLLLTAFRQVPLVDPAPIAVPNSVSQSQVLKAIEMSLTQRGWAIAKKVPGEVDATYAPRDFSVTIAVHYTVRQIQINYVTSSNLRYEVKNGTRYIHANYDSWIKNLVRDISNDVQMASP